MLRLSLPGFALAFLLASTSPPSAVLAEDRGLEKPSFDSAGVPIHYLVKGPGDAEPLVLIHGFACNIDTQWGPLIPSLQKEFKVIALDCRGHGSSGKPHDPKMYGVEMVEDVARLLDHLKIERAHIAGYSMGGTIALALAVRHPQRVRSLVLGGSGAWEAGREKLMLEVAESLENGRGLGPLLTWLTPPGKKLPPETIKLLDRLVLSQNDPLALAAVIRGALGSHGLTTLDERIGGIRAPILAVIGADDPLRPSVDRLKQLARQTKVVVIDHADHMTAPLRPEFLAAMQEFLGRMTSDR